MTTFSSSPSPLTTAVTGHVGLNVTDAARSIDFYQRVFGFEVLGEGTEEGRRFAFLGHGEDLVLTLWQQSTDQFPTSLPGLHHLAFNVATLEDVQAAMTHLHELGVPLVHDSIMAHLPGASSGGIFFTDPDGIRLEICTSTGMEGHSARDDGAPSCGFF